MLRLTVLARATRTAITTAARLVTQVRAARTATAARAARTLVTQARAARTAAAARAAALTAQARATQTVAAARAAILMTITTKAAIRQTVASTRTAKGAAMGTVAAAVSLNQAPHIHTQFRLGGRLRLSLRCCTRTGRGGCQCRAPLLHVPTGEENEELFVHSLSLNCL